MNSLTQIILSILAPFSVLFSKPSWKKALTLLIGALLCTNKRTICSALRAMGLSTEASFSKYHHLLNRTGWSTLEASRILFFMLLRLISSDAPIRLLVDETLERRRGKKINAKGYYRDAVRSSKSQIVKTTGLKWLVMAFSFRFSFMKRAIALPFFSILEPSKKYNEGKKRRHKTTLQWTSQMICQVRRWVGRARKIVLVGDGGFAVGRLLLDCARHGVALVSRLKMNAALFDFPEESPGKRGRKPLKGKKLINFKEMLKMGGLPWQELEIVGYNGIKHVVRFITAICMWGADGITPVPIKWVLVIDPSGKLDPLPLMSSDLEMEAKEIIELYIDRWGLEVTFEETREYLGVETQRQWSDKAIERTTSILMGLYSLVCLMGKELHQRGRLLAEQCAWYQKDCPTFSDILKTVRLILWKDNLISRKGTFCPSGGNSSQEAEEWMDSLVRCFVQAA